MAPAIRSMKGSGAIVGVLYPGYRGSPIMAPPLLVEEEGPPT
jgi:hypothetical protein